MLSNTDIAYKILKETTGGLPFATIWDEIISQKEYTIEEREDLISNFYTDIMLDGRFITLGENTWDLRENHSFDKVHIDMNDVYSSEDEIIEAEEGIIAKEDTDESLFEEEELVSSENSEEEK